MAQDPTIERIGSVGSMILSIYGPYTIPPIVSIWGCKTQGPLFCAFLELQVSSTMGWSSYNQFFGEGGPQSFRASFQHINWQLNLPGLPKALNSGIVLKSSNMI